MVVGNGSGGDGGGGGFSDKYKGYFYNLSLSLMKINVFHEFEGIGIIFLRISFISCQPNAP